MQRLSLAVLILGAGCTYNINDAGTDPLSSQFYFPSGIAIDPIRPFLYLVNANADLHYAGGTLQVVDLERFDCALDRVRGRPLVGRCADPSLAADVGLCTYDPSDANVIVCDETPFVVPGATVKIGNFAGDIRVLVTGGDTRRLFAAVRGDPSITWIDVNLADPAAPPGSTVTTNCFDNPAAAHASGSVPGCDRSHLIQDFQQPVPCIGTGPTGIGCPSMPVTLPPEPFGMVLDPPGDRPDGLLADGVTRYRRLVTSHLAGGQVTVINARAAPFIESISGAFFPANQAQQHGAFGLAAQTPGDARTLYYLTSTLVAQIAGFRIADAEVVSPAFTFPLSAYGSGADGRELRFEPGGARAFLAENNPPSVAVIDTRPSATSGLTPANQIVDVIPVCQEPSHLALRTGMGMGAAGAPPLPETRLYVVCFLANQVMVIDPDRAIVLDTIVVGRGPNELAFYEALGGKPAKRAYVSNFGDWTLSMIDLDSGSPTHDRVVARIGLPTPPRLP